MVIAADLLTRVELSTPDRRRIDLGHYRFRAQRDRRDRSARRCHGAGRVVSRPSVETALLITAHHLAVDVVSWHIILGDIIEAWRSARMVEAPTKDTARVHFLPPMVALMWERAAEPEVHAQRDYWIAQVHEPDPTLGLRHPDPTRDTWSTLRVARVVTPVPVTERLLAVVTRDEGVRIPACRNDDGHR